MKKMVYILIIVFFLFVSFKVNAFDRIDIDINSHNAILYNVTDDFYMYEKNDQESLRKT